MGACCSKSPSNFDGPGRQLGSAPAPPNRAAVPPQATKPKITGVGRTLGGSPGSASASASASVEDPRAAAARAAEARAAKAQPKGKLGEQLAAQKAQTHNEALKAASGQERGARLQDENAVSRAWN